ncbi:MAG: hypothetical protein KF886_04295 [Candidatus Hydrogenedentes bacterium]|nr:hypothetical protein [Candidatus Hydrogenedentota bacterium]
MLINSASSIATRLLGLTVLVWLQQYLLKRVSPEEYSLLVVLYNVIMFAPLLTMVLTGGLGRYVVEAYAREDDERVTQIVSTMFPILLGAGVIMLLGGGLFSWYIDYVLTIDPGYLPDARLMMGLLMFSLAVRLPMSAFTVGLYVRQRFVTQNLIQVGCELFRLALLFVLLFGIEIRVLWIVVASVTSELLNLIISLAISVRIVPQLRFRRAFVYWPIARELTGFGGWSFVASLATTVRTSADAIILNKLSTPLEVATSHVGTLASRHVYNLSLSALAPTQPALTAMHATNDTARMQNAYLRGGRIALWASLFPTFLLAVYSGEIMHLYAGPNFPHAGAVLAVSMLLFPVSYGTIMTSGIANAKGQIRKWALISSAMNVFNLALTIYVVYWLGWGALGAAASTIVCMVVFYPLFVVPLGLELVGLRYGSWIGETLWPGMLPGLAGAVVSLVYRSAVDIDTWLAIAVSFIPGSFAYLAVLGLCLRPSDRDDLWRIVRRYRAKLRPRGEAG